MNSLIEDIKTSAKPLEGSSLLSLARSVRDAKVVMLGEATHGTTDFYRLRRLLTQELISEHGFGFVAVEGDWPDCQRLNRYIFRDEGESARAVLEGFRRWPTWMWANEEIVPLIEWLREEGVGFYGLDVYSLFESIEAVRRSLKHFDALLAKRIDDRYACFDRFGRDETAYARSLGSLPDGCHRQVLANLRELLRVRLKGISTDSDLFDVQQNARIIANAEHYYRSMMGGDALSWNIRDNHMMETLEQLLLRAGPDAKAVVWAHNTHIGDYHAADMLEEGSINIGGLARERFGPENVELIGFGTYQGTVTAGASWGAPVRSMKLPAAKPESWEDVFHEACLAMKRKSFILNLRDGNRFAEKRGHRAVGVVYDPRFEAHGRNYVPTKLSARYDHFIFVDQTSALRPLETIVQQGLIPETWPAGL